MKCNGVISSVSMEVAHVYEVKCNKVTVFNFWFHILDLEVFGSVIAFLSQPILYIFPCMNYIGKISGWNWKFFRPTTAQDIRERENKDTFVWLVNLICDFIGQSAKSDSKSRKKRKGERQLWRRRSTFSLIQIDSLFLQKRYLLFVVEALYYKGKSWRVIDGSIHPSESKPTVFGATKSARRGGKFRLSRNVCHYYQSFQHWNGLLLIK